MREVGRGDQNRQTGGQFISARLAWPRSKVIGLTHKRRDLVHGRFRHTNPPEARAPRIRYASGDFHTRVETKRRIASARRSAVLVLKIVPGGQKWPLVAGQTWWTCRLASAGMSNP